MGKLLNGGYGAIFGTYWMIYAAISSFASVFMLAKGYTNSEIGVTLAAANVLAVVIQPLVADFVDRSKKLGVLETTEIMTAAMMVFGAGLFAFKGGTAALCIVFVLLIGFHTTLQPLFNSLAFRLEQAGVSMNFGIARSVGSLAYSVFIAILGVMVERLGIGVISVSTEITCLMLRGSLLLTGRHCRRAVRTGGEAPKPEEREPEINLIRFIQRNRMFFIMNLGVFGIYFSNAVLNFFMAQIVDGAGGGTEDVGIIFAVMAFLEIPTMVFFKHLRKRFSSQLLLKVAAIGFTAKIAICWLGNSVLMIFIAQFLQPVSFALFLPGIVHFSDEMLSRGEAVKGQALFTTMVTATTVAASLLGGVILDASGTKMLTFIATVVTAAGAAVVIFFVDKVKNNRDA